MNLSPVSLTVSDLHLAVGSRTLIEGLSFSVTPGQCLSLMGPSGCGKSSVLAFIAGTLDPAFAAQGSVALGTQSLLSLPPEKRGIGILFQDDLLFPHMTVGENLGFALPRGQSREKRQQAIEQALEQADLKGYAPRHPATLSGGQRARVALMRTLLAKPKALLLDEPFSKLDTHLRREFRDFVFGFAQSEQLPTIVVTHDQADTRGEVITL
jgi:putative thiamine transport system ATP-binding protein